MSAESQPTHDTPSARWPAVAAAAWIGCALFLTLVPSRPRWLFPDLTETVGHLLLGLLLGGSLFCLTRALLPRPRSWAWPAAATGMVCTAFLIGTEILQGVTATRSPQLADALADALGAALIIAVLAVAFAAGPPVADRASNAFVAVAIATALVVVVTGIASPYEPPRTTWPVTGAVACVAAYSDDVTASPGPVTGDAPPEPLVAFDLAGDPTGSVAGTLAPIALSAVGGAVVRPGVGVEFRGAGDALRATPTPDGLVRSITGAQAFTIEAWIRPADLDQEGPSRIVTLSTGIGRGDVNVHLGIERDRLSVRLRTACGPLWFLAGELDGSTAHVAATFDHRRLALFVDGERVAVAELDGADLSTWDPSYDLTIGNEVTLDRGYRGVVASVAFYREALSTEQIAGRAATTAPRSALNSGGGRGG